MEVMLPLTHVLSFVEMASTLDLPEMTETVSMETDAVLGVLLSFLDLQCGSAQVEMPLLQTSAMNGVGMDSDMKTHMPTIQEEICSSFKK